MSLVRFELIVFDLNINIPDFFAYAFLFQFYLFVTGVDC